MKIVAFVPIKMNSARLPMKNIKSFTNGKPLISYILSTLEKVKKVDEIYVYCSSDEICKYLPNRVKLAKRDPYYDLDSTSFNEVLSSFANIVKADIYVLAHATAPFLSEKSISLAIDSVASKNYDSAFTVNEMQEFLWKGNSPINYNLDSIPRTQDLDKIQIETCGLYVYTRDLIINKNRRIGNNANLIKVSKIEAIDINTMEDFVLADAIFNYNLLYCK